MGNVLYRPARWVVILALLAPFGLFHTASGQAQPDAQTQLIADMRESSDAALLGLSDSAHLSRSPSKQAGANQTLSPVAGIPPANQPGTHGDKPLELENAFLPFVMQRPVVANEVAAGYGHTCALNAGGVLCWGLNYDGQLGDGSGSNHSTPVAVRGLFSSVAAVAAGGYHTCALTASGEVQCWGDNYNGQLGDGTKEERSTPVEVTGLDSKVAAIAAGYNYTCALTTSGGVKCWGGNEVGQLGDGTMVDSSVPVDVIGLNSGVTTISVGGRHTCALTASGGVKCWGYNWAGQVGDGTNEYIRPMPVEVSGLTYDVVGIAAGGYHTCALTNSGEVKCWGNNDNGQLGDGTSVKRSTPVDVSGLASGVAAITAAEDHTCALTVNNRVECWGINEAGQLGDGTTAEHTTPVAVDGLAGRVDAISAGYGHTCAQMADDGLKCWGDNDWGQLGDGTTTDRSPLVDVSGLSSEVDAITADGNHTCALLTSGETKCWGRNDFGQLGDGTTVNRSTPVDIEGLSNNITAITAGGLHSCAVTSGGGVKCWGLNYYGQLGDGTSGINNFRATLVDVSGLFSGVAEIVAGKYHTCALTTGDGVKCWGLNNDGQVGGGTKIYSLPKPVDVSGLTSGVAALSAGGNHTCALTISGRVKCWGDNEWGQLGDGTSGYGNIRLTPVYVSGLTSGIAGITVGNEHTCALTAGGGVKCWGRNNYGQLGDGTSGKDIIRTTPVSVIGLSSGVTALAADGNHTCALMMTGGVKCWGDNINGQLGYGSAGVDIIRSTPVDVSGLTSEVVGLAAGGSHTCALMISGGVKCWGGNEYGELGNGPLWVPVDVIGFGG